MMALTTPTMEEIVSLAPEQQHLFVMGMVMQLAQAVTEMQGTLNGHTQMLGKICRQVGVSKQELLDTAKAVRDG